MTRWETITGTSHVVERTPADRAEYPLARPGDRVVRLEADTGGRDHNRLAATFIVDGSASPRFNLFDGYMRKAVDRLEKMGAT